MRNKPNIFNPQYHWIRTTDILPVEDEKVLIVRDVGDYGELVDRLVVETACFQQAPSRFTLSESREVKVSEVLFWSLFPFDLENEVYEQKEE